VHPGYDVTREPRLHSFDIEDCAISAELLSAVYPELPPWSPDLMHHRLNTVCATGKGQRWILEVDGAPIAEASWFLPPWTSGAEVVRAQIIVMPEHRSRGWGHLMYEVISASMCQANRFKMRVIVRDNDPLSLDFAQRRDFTEMMTLTVSSVATERALSRETMLKVDRAKGRGTTVVNGAQLLREYSNWAHLWWDAYVATAADTPSPEPARPIPFDDFKQIHLESPKFDPSRWFFAIQDGQIIGLTGLHLSPSRPEAASVDFTGVRLSHRRRGVCRLLKVTALEHARSWGIELIYTENEVTNPMLCLNRELGFRRLFNKGIYAGSVLKAGGESVTLHSPHDSATSDDLK
jgi:GNAT superfamily N-acetyltransferase